MVPLLHHLRITCTLEAFQYRWTHTRCPSVAGCCGHSIPVDPATLVATVMTPYIYVTRPVGLPYLKVRGDRGWEATELCLNNNCQVQANSRGDHTTRSEAEQATGSEAEQAGHDRSNKEQPGPGRGDRSWAATELRLNMTTTRSRRTAEAQCAAKPALLHEGYILACIKGSLTRVLCHEPEAQSTMKLLEITSILCMGKPCGRLRTRKERLLLAIHRVWL